MYYVYILTNNYNRVLYVGVTNDLSRRVAEHKQGVNDGFTHRYNVNKLVYAEAHKEVETAIRREKQLKAWRHDKKERLIESINPNWEELPPF